MNKSRIFFLIQLLFLLGISSAYGQIGMHLKAIHPRYLRYEKIDVTLTISNVSGNTLIFGNKQGTGEGGKIFFSVKEHSGKVARSFDATVNPASSLILAAGESRELTVTINMLHDMQREGVYTVQAFLNHDRLPRTHISNTVNLEVLEGSTVLVRDVGLPSQSATDLIKSIRLSLLLFPDPEEKQYCLRAEDDENVYAVFRLGPYLSGTPPQMDVDGSSSVHILLQVRPRLYSYLIFSFIGRNLQLRQQRYYVPDGGTPTLSRSTGYLRITNGKVATEGVDYKIKK